MIFLVWATLFLFANGFVTKTIDGDMKYIFHRDLPLSDNRHHSAFDDNSYLWKKGQVEGKWQIPYAFDQSVQNIDGVLYNTISGAEQSVVESVISGMNTKLRSLEFIPRTTEQFYLGIGNFGYGCWSYVGDVTEYLPVQPINFGRGCYTTAIIEHEIMHALGFGHEHARGDRDEHVTINWNNLDSRYKDNFAVMSNTYSWGVEYDYRSVMHYAQYAFSKSPGLPTIVTLDSSFQSIIGTASEMSDSDILQIELLYRCPDGPRNYSTFCTPDCPCYHLEGECQEHQGCVDDLVCVEPGDQEVVDSPARVCMFTHVAGQTREPTGVPTPAPTSIPTAPTTAVPTGHPTVDLQDIGTLVPTQVPTTRAPTFAPSVSPTDSPTPFPTPIPTHAPTASPGGLEKSEIVGISVGISVGVVVGVAAGAAFVL
jgi:hypothetical protein